MKSLLNLVIIFCIPAIIIFSCSKSTNPGSITPDSVTRSCINVSLTSPKGTDSQTVGFNVPISPITYKISNNQSSDTSGLGIVSVSAIGLPPGINTTYKGGVLTIFGSAIKDSSSPYVYVIATTGNGCSLPLTGVIAVKECATIALTSSLATIAQIVPSNTAIIPITYSVGGGATGATATGLPSGLTNTFSGGVLTISGTVQNAPDSDYKYKVTTTGGYCSSYDSGFLIVTTCPMVTLTSSVGTDKQTIAINQPIQPITYTVTGHYLSFSLTGSFPYGVNAVINGNTVTITGTPICQTCNGQSYLFEYGIQVVTADNWCGPLTKMGFIDVE